MGLDTASFRADIYVDDILFLGETRSADELAAFTNMAPERLCLGCGLRVSESFVPISVGERGHLFTASTKLLKFALRALSASANEDDMSVEEVALLQAIRPLLQNADGHFLATLIALVQSLLEGKTDCPISGVFGAGKTRAAAAMIGGLLVMDPTLKIMVVTKENVAALAFTRHFGGGFRQECSQPYSPVGQFMAEVHLALNDEGQQYGNLDEAAAIVRIPRNGLVVWCGDHKQTPGGLRKGEGARAFRRKLMQRPVGLRGDTVFIQPHTMGASRMCATSWALKPMD